MSIICGARNLDVSDHLFFSFSTASQGSSTNETLMPLFMITEVLSQLTLGGETLKLSTFSLRLMLWGNDIKVARMPRKISPSLNKCWLGLNLTGLSFYTIGAAVHI